MGPNFRSLPPPSCFGPHPIRALSLAFHPLGPIPYRGPFDPIRLVASIWFRRASKGPSGPLEPETFLRSAFLRRFSSRPALSAQLVLPFSSYGFRLEPEHEPASFPGGVLHLPMGQRPREPNRGFPYGSLHLHVQRSFFHKDFGRSPFQSLRYGVDPVDLLDFGRLAAGRENGLDRLGVLRSGDAGTFGASSICLLHSSIRGSARLGGASFHR